MSTVIFHADLDAFFASVEQNDKPELRGLPVIVGAMPGHRGVVSACSYEARAFGVHSALPISTASRLCPHGVFLPVRMGRYQEVSRRVMAIFGDFTPDVRQISVDEAFLDMSGTTGLFGPPIEAAAKLKTRVREETGLTVSVGVGANRYIAKIASARSKPDGLLEIASGQEEAFLDSLPLSKLWGIGEKTLDRLNRAGLDSIPYIRELSAETLGRAAGQALGEFLYRAVRGIDPGIFSDEPKTRSMSGETTFEHDVVDDEPLEATILEQSQELMFRLLEGGVRSRTVHLKLRYADFETVSAQETLDRWIVSADEIRSAALSLLKRKRDRERAIRLIGVGVAVTQGTEGGQNELFPNPSERQAAVERAVLELKKGKGATVTKARLLPRTNDKAKR